MSHFTTKLSEASASADKPFSGHSDAFHPGLYQSLCMQEDDSLGHRREPVIAVSCLASLLWTIVREGRVGTLDGLPRSNQF